MKSLIIGLALALSSTALASHKVLTVQNTKNGKVTTKGFYLSGNNPVDHYEFCYITEKYDVCKAAAKGAAKSTEHYDYGDHGVFDVLSCTIDLSNIVKVTVQRLDDYVGAFDPEVAEVSKCEATSTK